MCVYVCERDRWQGYYVITLLLRKGHREVQPTADMCVCVSVCECVCVCVCDVFLLCRPVQVNRVMVHRELDLLYPRVIK